MVHLAGCRLINDGGESNAQCLVVYFLLTAFSVLHLQGICRGSQQNITGCSSGESGRFCEVSINGADYKRSDSGLSMSLSQT